MIRQQQEMNQTLIEVLKAVAPESFEMLPNGELRNSQTLTLGEMARKMQTMKPWLLDKMAESLKQRVLA